MSKHLTLTDRAIIEKYLAQDMSFSFTAKHVRNSTVKAYVHSTFLHIVLCWINRLMFALVVQMRRHAKETMPTTLLIGRTLNTSKN